MRIWDVSPGYLSRQRLLGEHRELHGLASILEHGKAGYSHHPETKRWVGALSGLIVRHEALAAEMQLRGYVDRTPLLPSTDRPRWPTTFITPPVEQFELLRLKYREDERGRIPLPVNAQELWAHHKYSVMARDPERYRAIGRRVAAMRRGANIGPLCEDLVRILQESIAVARAVNAVEHMWGHVAKHATVSERAAAGASAESMWRTTWTLAQRVDERYLLHSTALSDLRLLVTGSSLSAEP